MIKKRIVITGAGGFIGSNIVRKLLEEHYVVHVIWKKGSSFYRLIDIKEKLIIHTVSLEDKENLTQVIKKIKPFAIFHMATYSDYREQEKIEEIIKVSINGTVNLLLASLSVPYSIFVNTGSSSEYGLKQKPMREKDLLEPVSFYAAAKAGATLLCQAFASHYDKPIVTFRPFSVYGPYEAPDRFIPTIIHHILEKRPILLTSGKQRRDFIYVKDIVSAYMKTLEHGKSLQGKVINLGTGKEFSNDEIVKILFRCIKQKVPIQKGAFPKRIWDTPHWVANIDIARKLLQWKPTYSVSDGLQETYEWYLKQKKHNEKK